MGRTDNLYTLPDGLPVPIDDGACAHLEGMEIPALSLPSTDGRSVLLNSLGGTTIVYVYPRTGRPDKEPLSGWNDISGARGCTPQSCAFRDQSSAFQELGANIFGLSTQDTAYQREAVERLHLPYALLSDERFEFANSLRLPRFELGETIFLKRVTLILQETRIEKVFYPVFPPDRNAAQVLDWLSHSRRLRV